MDTCLNYWNPFVPESGVSLSDCVLDLLGSNRRVWVEIMLYGRNIIDQFDDRFFDIRVLENPPDAELASSKAAPTGDECVDSMIILRELSETSSEFLREELPLGVQSVLICAHRTEESRD